MEQQGDGKRTIISGVISIAILVVLVGGVMALQAKTDNKSGATSKLALSTKATPAEAAASQGDTTATNTTTPSATTPTVAPSDTQTTSPVTLAYKNGTYTASGAYTTPESTETISVTVTLSNDAVSDVSLTGQPQAHESRDYQALFEQGYKNLVVGKNIDSINLSRVSGSSLTSRGFNNAIAQIKNQARS